MPSTQTNRQTQTNKEKIAEREYGVKKKCTTNDDSIRSLRREEYKLVNDNDYRGC